MNRAHDRSYDRTYRAGIAQVDRVRILDACLLVHVVHHVTGRLVQLFTEAADLRVPGGQRSTRRASRGLTVNAVP